MSYIRITRFSVDPSKADLAIERRATLIKTVRAGHPGLIDARLVRVDERSYLDIWRWESQAALDAASATVPGSPEAGAAFSVVENPTLEAQGELVDES
ncbi:hypothetical protein G5C51_19595 [Streptomyces sp. A7024]|uniref:ABM domain-containing protein n=1 Tax=Streptomyces coryli TaxID=1128680 RepID=A0A6G4U2W4_9ACTN|nr:antibiotic biosynthesis monooxygenase [Streptomyces coryli]NGN66090.1 hypothetical protein [Streptomyces coryli]